MSRPVVPPEVQVKRLKSEARDLQAAIDENVKTIRLLADRATKAEEERDAALAQLREAREAAAEIVQVTAMDGPRDPKRRLANALGLAVTRG